MGEPVTELIEVFSARLEVFVKDWFYRLVFARRPIILPHGPHRHSKLETHPHTGLTKKRANRKIMF